MLRRLRGGVSMDDLAVYINDVDKMVGNIKIFRVGVPGFSNRAIYIGGLPHISLEDYLASLPLNNDQDYLRPLSIFNLTHVDLPLTLRLAREAGTLSEVKRLLRGLGLMA